MNLEDLTAAERNMLYAMRSYARFRKLFYVAVVAGSSGLGLTNNPYGLQGLSVNLGRGIGGNLTAPVVGFLPLLQSAAVIANQQKNVTFLDRLLHLYVAFREGGQQSDLQVGQVEVSLLTSQGQLLGSAGGGGGGGGGSGIRGYLDSLDNFKLQLGLPMTLGLDLDNTPLRPMHLQLARFEDVYADLRNLEEDARKYDPAQPVAQFRPRWRQLLTESSLMKGTTFAKTIGDTLGRLGQVVGGSVRRSRWHRSARSGVLSWTAARTAKARGNRNRRQKLVGSLETGGRAGLGRVRACRPGLRGPALGSRKREPCEPRPRPRRSATPSTPSTRSPWKRETNGWRSLAASGRIFRHLPVNGTDVLTGPIDDAYTAGIQAALSNRLDLMNARGQVVDAYRQIAVQANSLQGVFNVQYNYGSATPTGGNQPFGFSGDRTSHQLAINAELPLVRRAERNNYRAALIGYQRQRRTLMAFEDNIANDVRSDIRQLRTLAELYRIQQRVVQLGYSQVDNAQALLIAPPAPMNNRVPVTPRP